MKISLAAAFRLRSKISSLIDSLRNNFVSVPRAVDEDDLERTNKRFETKDCDGDIQLLLDLMTLLETINVTIDRANIGGRELLNKIAACKAKIDLLGSEIHRRITTDPYRSERNMVTGEIDSYELTLIGAKDWDDELTQLKVERNSLEDRLCEYNGSTKVDIEIPAHLEGLVAAA